MKKTIMVLVGLVAVGAVFVTSAVHGQEWVTGRTAVLRGQVVTVAGEPIAGVKVEIRGEGKVRTAMTNADGRFRFTRLAPGKYEVEAKLQGFDAATQEIDLKPFRDSVVRLIGLPPEPRARISPGEPGMGRSGDAVEVGESSSEGTTTPPPPQPTAGETFVVEKEFREDLALQEFLNEERSRGHELRIVVSLAPGRSLFVYERRGEPAASTVIVNVGAEGDLTADRLGTRIGLQPTKTFVGIHWLSSGAAGLVFRDGR